MRRKHYMLMIGQGLSYLLVVTFLFADSMYNFTGIFRDSGIPITVKSAYISSCFIGILGSINMWLTYYYITKSNRVSEMLVICAWTHRIKTKEGWVSLETFLSDQFGYAISHGLSTQKLAEMRNEIDRDWNKMERSKQSERVAIEDGKRPMGLLPQDAPKASKRNRPQSKEYERSSESIHAK